MQDFIIKSEIKNQLTIELGSFIEIADWKIRLEEEDAQELRDEAIEELQDQLVNILERYSTGYHKGLEIALGLRYWNFEDATFKLENAEDLGFNAAYEYVTDEGLIYDAVDEFFNEELNFEFC